MARETILKILRDPSLKVRKRGIVVKMICPLATFTLRNYMIVLLSDKNELYGCDGGYSLRTEFAVNLAGEPSNYIGVPESAYIVKPTLKDYFELWDMYRKCKGKIWRLQ